VARKNVRCQPIALQVCPISHFDRDFLFQPTITIEEMTGFSLFALKAVLSGRGDEIVDLAKVNFSQQWFW